MKIAIPTNRVGEFCEHFGGAEAFAFCTVDDQSRLIGEIRLDSPPEHGRGVFPVWLSRQGASVVLAGSMGPRAIDIFSRKGIEVVVGVREEETEIIVRKYLEGSLETTNEVCHEHGFHDCGHDHRRAGVSGCDH